LALRVVAHAQMTGGLAAFLDLGHTLAPTAAAAIGCDLATLAVFRPTDAATAARIVQTLLVRRAVGALVVDSLPR